MGCTESKTQCISPERCTDEADSTKEAMAAPTPSSTPTPRTPVPALKVHDSSPTRSPCSLAAGDSRGDSTEPDTTSRLGSKASADSLASSRRDVRRGTKGSVGSMGSVGWSIQLNSARGGESRAASKASMGSVASAASRLTATSASPPGERIALNRYVYNNQKSNILGEGTSSLCYLGTDIETGGKVAVKVYKSSSPRPECQQKIVKKFKRQVSTLLELQEPFQESADRRHWTAELASTSPADLFVQLLDYSRNATGSAGPGADGTMFVVTELAQETLKSFVKRHLEAKDPLPVEQVRQIAREVTLAMSGLHAKGLVHLDMKPENIMMCSGRWKLIDMDGCFRNGSVLQQSNSSVSFSPCYCAPEFAAFVSKGGNITVTPALDVWSVGLTIAELVELCPLLRASYQQVANGLSRKEGSKRFLKWLSSQKAAPRLTKACDRSFARLLDESLLVVNQTNRSTLAESLGNAFYSVAPAA